jgi:CTP:molybdopterin cytidylyltransferase MocA/uncharacterized damage-inducible protein DinB
VPEAGVSVAGVLLAAGGSRRLGSPKQLLKTNGVTLVERAARQLLDAGCAPVVVVVGAEAAAVRDAVALLPVICVENTAWERGMGTSIAEAVIHLNDVRFAQATAVLIATCDMPTVTAAHLGELLSTAEPGDRRVASAYAGPDGAPVRGIPAVLPRADWPDLAALDGDQGARVLLRDTLTLTVSLRQGNFDLDTPADVAAWRSADGVESTDPTPPPPSPNMSLVHTALADLDHEMANTRKMLERIPEGHLDFTPHEKSWPLGKLANHLTDFGMWGEMTITTSELDFEQPMPPRPPTPTTAAGFVAQFDAGLEAFRTALATVTDEQLMETWTMRSGAHVIMAMPKLGVLRGMVISHMIHHRAQLTMYYRLLNVPVPGLYGPSADEQ